MAVAERWKDRLGDRLFHPDWVRDEDRHLIPDDWQRVRAIAKIRPDTKPVHILEVGCGDGTMTGFIQEAHPCAIVQAVDVEEWDIRQSAPAHLKGPYTVIYCCEVLEHLTYSDAYATMKNLLQVLSPGGHLILSVPNSEPALHYTAGCRDRWRWPDHRSWWTRRTFQELLRSQLRSATVTWYPLYPEDQIAEHSIWLIAMARFV
jgi:predicted SAM-dependent methyltransferase